MLTYEDFLKCESEEKKIDFILRAIEEHKRSDDYKIAVVAEAYYDGENPTIMQYEKILYDLAGKAHVDMWSANHKIASSFFTFVVDQEVSYLLGNGILFNSDETKDRLGLDFDEEVMDALEYARVAGVSFGFWNVDHIDVFKLKEFVPIKGEETGSIMLGIRFWQLETDKPLRVTLYEIEGYTEYIQRAGKAMEIMEPRQAYKKKVTSTPAEGELITDGENYPSLPIVPLYSNKAHKSAIVGHRNTIDALDLATSNMVNNVDEGSLIYWVLSNAGGMDDIDDVKFIERLKTVHVAHIEDDGSRAEAHTIEAPFEGTNVTIDMLIKRLYDDFQAFNSAAVTASNQTATAIQASYVPLDLKTDKIERQVTRFILGILKLAGINDRPTYQRNQLINKQEETQSLSMQAAWLPADYIAKKMLALNGDIDRYDEIMDGIDAEAAARITGGKDAE